MLRLLLIGLLFVAVPALVVAQEDPKDKNGANKDGDKKDAKADSGAAPGGQEGWYERSWYGRVVDAGIKIVPLVQIVLLTLIVLLLLGLRSDIAAFMEKTSRG